MWEKNVYVEAKEGSKGSKDRQAIILAEFLEVSYIDADVSACDSFLFCL